MTGFLTIKKKIVREKF